MNSSILEASNDLLTLVQIEVLAPGTEFIGMSVTSHHAKFIRKIKIYTGLSPLKGAIHSFNHVPDPTVMQSQHIPASQLSLMQNLLPVKLAADLEF